MTPPKLETRGLAKRFSAPGGDGEAVVALAGLDLKLGAGDFVSIVGPSGCGKSTLFNILAGLVTPSAGEVVLDGQVAEDTLGRIGYMPQRDLLMPWRTVLDNATLGLTLAGQSKSRARARAREELPRFGLQGFERRWPRELSGGMRQRAALLRTFLAGRDVLLLDEPFGALDALTRQRLQEWLLDIWQSDGKTILFVTHDVEEAVFLSDRVHVMSGRPGRIVASVDIDLPRPRHLDITTSEAFTELKERLMRPLREASLAQAGVTA